LDLSGQDLEGDLDLTGFASLWEVDISGNVKLGEVIDKKGSKTLIRIEAQDWLNLKYPNKQEVRKIELESERDEYKTKIDIYGELIVSDFPQL